MPNITSLPLLPSAYKVLSFCTALWLSARSDAAQFELIVAQINLKLLICLSLSFNRDYVLVAVCISDFLFLLKFLLLLMSCLLYPFLLPYIILNIACSLHAFLQSSSNLRLWQMADVTKGLGSPCRTTDVLLTVIYLCPQISWPFFSWYFLSNLLSLQTLPFYFPSLYFFLLFMFPRSFPSVTSKWTPIISPISVTYLSRTMYFLFV